MVNYTRYKRKQSPAKSTIDFLGFWEKSNNPDSNPIEFDRLKKKLETIIKAGQCQQ